VAHADGRLIQQFAGSPARPRIDNGGIVADVSLKRENGHEVNLRVA
jgi:hypothetical protein